MYMPSCSTLGETERTTQLLWSYLYDDVGLWQINPYHHPNSIKPGNYLNLYRTIDWGLNYLYNGNGTDNAGGFTFIRDLVSSLDDRKNEKKESRERFKNARGEFKQLCRYNFNSDPYRTNSSLPGKYYNLLRGVWGGQYNSGTTKAIGPNSEGNRVRTKLMANGKVACRASLSKFELTRNEQNKIIRNSKLSMKKISNEKEKKEVAKQHAILLQTAADEIEAKLKSAEGACKISRASITGGYCRFQYPKEFLHPRVRENDTGFEKKLSRVVIENTSIYHNRLPKGSLERKAFDEIIYNFRSIYKKGVQKEKNQALAKLLKETRSYKRETVIMPERFEGAVTHLLLPGSINYYSLPSHIEEKQNNYCGYVSNENVTVGELKLQSKSSKTYKLSDGSEWIQVHFPDYSAMNRKEKRIEYVELADREQLKHVNIRIAPPRASKDPSVRGNVYAKKVCKNIDDKGECKKTFAFRRNKENISSKHKLLGIDEQSGWYKVDLGDGRFGYVSGLEKFTKLVKVNKAHKTEDCERSEYFYIQKDHTLSFEGMFDYDFGTLLVRKGSTKVFSEPLRNRYNKKKILEYLPEGEILISMGMESIDIATASGSATHYFHRIVYPSREGCNIRNFEINKCTAFVFSGDRVSKLEQ